MARKRGIPGLSFSWKRATGLSAAKGKLSRQLGVPLTRHGRQRKLGKAAGCCVPLIAMVGVLLLLISACATQGVNQDRFRDVYRAGKEVESAVQTGVPYVQFAELCRRLTSEVSIANDQSLSSTEREMLVLYGEAVSGCRDALDVWQKVISGQSQFLVGSNDGLRRIASDYAISGSGRGPGFTFHGMTAVQAIMEHIAMKAGAAARIYSGANRGGRPDS